jgi:hypothetical protein
MKIKSSMPAVPFLFSIMALLLLSGCTDDNTTGPASDQEEALALRYYPMIAGNAWIYASGEDTSRVSTLAFQPHDQRLLSEGEIGVYTFAGDGSEMFYTATIRGDSVMRAGDDRALLLRLNPALVGDSIRIQSEFPASFPQKTWQVLLDDDHTVEVPAGSFESCLLVEEIWIDPADGSAVYKRQTAYAPGVGRVWSQLTYDRLTGTPGTPSELIEYRIGD